MVVNLDGSKVEAAKLSKFQTAAPPSPSMRGGSKQWLALLLVAICLFEVAVGINEHLQDEEEPEYDDSDVMELDTDEFKEALENHPNMMVFWYAPWCGEFSAFTTRHVLSEE